MTTQPNPTEKDPTKMNKPTDIIQHGKTTWGNCRADRGQGDRRPIKECPTCKMPVAWVQSQKTNKWYLANAYLLNIASVDRKTGKQTRLYEYDPSSLHTSNRCAAYAE